MRIETSQPLRRPVVVLLCVQLLLPLAPRPACAAPRPAAVTVEIGQPSVWSLGQAHYLLSRMHERNKGLATKFPNEDALDPNRQNGARIDTLRTLLGVEAQFDQSIGRQNEINTQRFEEERDRRDEARVRLETRRAELGQVREELLDLEVQVAELQAEDDLAEQVRKAATPPEPPGAADLERKKELAALKVRRDAKKAQKESIESEITALSTTANTSPATPTLATPTVAATPGMLPALSKALDKAFDDEVTPSLAASTALDNFVHMQYEIVAKQLTLLRDEVGPEERVIFLELPTSIYTVDKWADNYVAQVTWQVSRICDKEPDAAIMEEVVRRNLERDGMSASEIHDEVAFLNFDKQRCGDRDHNDLDRDERCRRLRDPRSRGSDTMDGQDEENAVDRPAYPITLDMIAAAARQDLSFCRPARQKVSAGRNSKDQVEVFERVGVRALEIIPRQSALNVNQHHAMTRNRNFLGVLKLVSGFGLKLDYQHQRELYENFLQQEVFASGFGKGRDAFGWTFGPLPGSKRIEPGQRTTYAVLAVPRNTLALHIMAIGKAFPRSGSPERVEPVEKTDFLVRIPGEKTERFWADRIDYTPVPKGKRVTALLSGSYFSPQLGVLVNGVPLRRSVSITRVGSEEAHLGEPGAGVDGEFEVVNSRQIVLNFSMGPTYVGTPLITLVTPERSTSINFFELKVNRGAEREMLHHLNQRDPMFVDGFSLGSLEDVATSSFGVADPGCQVKAGGKPTLLRLKGSGLLPRADISVDDRVIQERIELAGSNRSVRLAEEVGKRLRCAADVPFIAQESTSSYLIYVPDRGDGVTVRYRQRTRQGFDAGEIERSFVTRFEVKLRHYRRGSAKTPAEVHLTVASENPVTAVTLIEPAVLDACQDVQQARRHEFRVKCTFPGPGRGEAERDFVSFKVLVNGTPDTYFWDTKLPVRPLVASLRNPRTGRAEGYASEEPVAFLEGLNLQDVTAVFFGDLEGKLTMPADPEILAVKIPKAEVARGQEALVPVLLQVGNGDKVPAGLFYTFKGAPLPKVVVGSPYRPAREDE